MLDKSRFDAQLEKALEQSANGQVVSRGSFKQYIESDLDSLPVEVIWTPSDGDEE